MQRMKSACILPVLLFFAAAIASAAARNGFLLVDDIEDYAAWDKAWSVSGGPEAAIFHDNKIVHSGKYSVRFRVKVNQKAGANPKYPSGWLFLKRRFVPFQDWSQYGALEFYIYIPRGQRAGSIRYGVRCADTKGEPIWNALVYPACIPTGEWTKVTLPLTPSTVKGDLRRVVDVTFYIAEKWFQDGDELNFYLDDFRLLKRGVASCTEGVRAAGQPIRIPESAKKVHEPLVYPVVPLEFIYPDTDMSSREPVKMFSLRAARGEVKPLTFAVLAGDDDIRDLKVRVSDFIGDGHRISGGRADVRVVKVWEQAGLRWEVFGPKEKIYVPELLLKDDRIALKDSRDEDGRYIPPSVLNVPFGTDIPAHTLKQIWINLSIPASAPGGTYRGRITLEAREGLKRMTFPVTVEVLPFTLPEPGRIYGLYYRLCLSGRIDFQTSRERMLADFREFKNVGFESLTIYFQGDEANIYSMMDLMKEAGLSGPVVIVNAPLDEEMVRRIVDAAKKRGLSLYFYGYDEPNSPERYKKHMKRSTFFHRLGQKVMVAATVGTAARLASEGEGLKWVNLPFPHGNTINYLQGEGEKQKIAPIQTYYWQVYEENPTRNRFLCGFYLHQSGLDGAFPYEYQGLARRSLAYSSDTRVSYKGGRRRIFRAWCLTYPSREGPVSTLQWEGCRLGVNDVRYVVYLEHLIKEARSRGLEKAASETEKRLAGVLAPFSRPPANPSVSNNPYVSPIEMEEAREAVIDLIAALREKITQ